MRLRLVSGVLALLLSAAAPAAGGREFQILYAEAARASSLRAETGPGKPEGAASLTFQAYGRQFEIELEPNRRLTNRLPAAQRKAFARFQLYRGRVRGMAQSWVRLTRTGSELQGLIWDGTDLYTVEPARLAAPYFSVSPTAQGSEPVIYRLADVQTDSSAAFCGLDAGAVPLSGSGARKNTQAAYNAMVSELQVAAATSGPKQIDIAVIADYEFRNDYSSDPQATAVARMNAVDGIFTEQLGVIIQVPEIKIFTTSSDPFTKSKASELLSELADYRNSTASIRGRGLAHLMTGRNLDGDTAGIAYLGSLCAPREGASLSEGWRSFTEAVLIAAHEIGHNFGAPHDGESGSACSSTPQNYLMAPVLNGSNRFSDCSLQQMQSEMQGAACITAAQIADATVDSAATARGYVGEAIDYPIDVVSLGSSAVQDVSVTIALSAVTVESASVPNGTCSIGTDAISCQIGTLPGETTRQIAVRFRPQQPGLYFGNIRLTAANDRTATNNERSFQVTVDRRASLSIAPSPTSIVAFTYQPLSFAATLTANGIDASTDVSIAIRSVGMNFDSVTAGNGTCTASGSDASCEFGTLAPGSTRQIQVQFTGTDTGGHSISLIGFASNNGGYVSPFATVYTSLSAQADAVLQFTPTGLLQGTLGQPFDFSVNVLSRGSMAVDNVVVTSDALPDIIIDSAAVQGGTCTVTAGTLNCALGSIAAGTSKRIDLRVRGTRTGTLDFPMRATASNDGDPDTDLQHAYINFAHPVDAGMDVIPFATPVEGRPFDLSVGITSSGRQTARNVRFTATLPPSFVIVSATAGAGACTVSGTVVTCTVAELAPNTRIFFNMQLRSDTAGDFTGALALTADDDALPDNNSIDQPFHVQPLVDVGVSVANNILTAIVGRPFELNIDVTTQFLSASNVRLQVNLPFWAVTADEVVAPGATCSIDTDRVTCIFAQLAAQSSTRITVRLHGTAPALQTSSTASLDVTGDIDSSNNYNWIYFTLLNPADAAISSTSTSLTGTAGQTFTYAFDITATGSYSSSDVRADVTLPAGLSFVSTAAGSIACSSTSTGVTCPAGTLDPGQKQSVKLNLRSETTGTYSVTSTLSSANDINAANDSQTISVSIAATPAPPANNNSGGGGGGGAFGWLTLLGLAAGLTKRWAVKTQPNPPLSR